jgi:hypothetical protein
MKKYIFVLVLFIVCSYNNHAQLYLSWTESLYIKGAKFETLSANKNNIALTAGFCETDSNKLDETFSFVEISTDGGILWNRILENRTKKTEPSPEKFISSSITDNNVIFILSDSGKVYISNDLGKNWNIIKINESDFKPAKIKVFKPNIIFIIPESGNKVIYSSDILNNITIKNIPDIKTILDVQYFHPDSTIFLAIPNDTSDIERRFITSKDGINWNNYSAPIRLNKLNFFDFNFGIFFNKKTYSNSDFADLKINATNNNGKDLLLIMTLPITLNTELDYDFIDFNNGMYVSYYSSVISEFSNSLNNIYSHYLTGDFYYYGYGFEHLCYPDFEHAYISSNYHQCIFRFNRNLVSVEESIKSNNILIFPNPARDFIYIQPSEGWQPSEGYDIQIFDLLGINVCNPTPTLPASRDGVRIDVSHLSPGIYFIKIGNRVEKFVKM